jgi:hypothetical protein
VSPNFATSKTFSEYFFQTQLEHLQAHLCLSTQNLDISSSSTIASPSTLNIRHSPFITIRRSPPSPATRHLPLATCHSPPAIDCTVRRLKTLPPDQKAD